VRRLTVLRDNKGVTLVEVLIAVVITLIVFMGLIQASILSIGVNMRNDLRDEAVRLSSDIMSQLRAAPFDDINRDGTADPSNPTAFAFNWDQDVAIRNTTIPYTIAVNVQWPTAGDNNHKQITITATWQWQGDTITHTISTFRGR
jgi:prepilin-type N-terminal cleavage/methylation domain-containing protein